MYRLTLVPLLLLLNGATSWAQTQTPPAALPEVMARGKVVTPLLAADARSHTDALMRVVDDRLQWSGANLFVTGTRAGGSGSGDDAFRPRSFVYRLPNSGELTGMVVWGRVHTQIDRSNARDETLLMRSNGNNNAGFAGVEWHDWMAVLGVHLSYQYNETQFISTPEEDGNLDTRIFGVHPYISVALGKASLWAMGGYGTGSMYYNSGRLNARVRADLKQVLYAGGLRLPIQVGLSRHTAIKGSYSKTRLQSDTAETGTLLLSALRGNNQQIRAAIDTNFYFAGDQRAFWWAQLDVGARYETGGGGSGFGADLSAALAYRNIGAGLSVQFYFQAVYLFSNGNYTGLGGGIVLSYEGADADGRGPKLSLTPTFGYAGWQPQGFAASPLQSAASDAGSAGTAGGSGSDWHPDLNSLRTAGIHLKVAWRY